MGRLLTMRYIAFLRAINVGGRVVKMQRLKELFQSLGLANVETFIASGNVIFESAARNGAALEQKIEKLLQEELGYTVKTFLRSDAELAAIAARAPFGDTLPPLRSTLFIGFLATAPRPEMKERLLAAQTPIDEFQIIGRELYWRCRGPTSDSTFSGAKLEKTLGAPTTLRNVNTVNRLVAKYPASS